MNELVLQFRGQLGRKQYDELEGTWLELMGAGTPPEELLELAALAERYAPRQTAVALLSVLADSLQDQQRFEQELAVLRRQAALAPDNAALSLALVACYRRLYGQAPGFEQALQKSGLGYGQNLKDALPRLDRYISFMPGRFVYDAERGPGRVKSLDLLLDRVTVDFDMGAELTWDIGGAQRRLQALRDDGYFATLGRDRRALLALVASEPGEVVARYLRDIGRLATVTDIRNGMAGAVGSEAWDGFWNRARKELGRNPHVLARTRPARTYEWVDEPLAAVEAPAHGGETVLRHEVSVQELAALRPDVVAVAYDRATSFAERKHFLERLKDARPSDWDAHYVTLFRTAKDSRARALMERELTENRPALWHSTLEGILTGYRQNLDAFLWLADSGRWESITPAKGLLTRMLDLLESQSHRPVWLKLRNAIVDRQYDILRRALESVDEAEAGRLMGRIAHVRVLEGYRADEMEQLIVARFPGLRTALDENVVYTTAAGLDKARAELRQLAQTEIPRSAEELARARAHGDLSENYEYKAAKEKQARLMSKMQRLRDEVARARTIAGADVDTSEVSFGCRVRIEDSSGTATEYVILGPWDADPERGVISYLSPFARLLMAKKPGETVEMDGRGHTIKSVESALAG